MPELTLAAMRYDSGLEVRISLDEPVRGGALLLSVTGAHGRLVAQERLPLPMDAVTLDQQILTDESPLRVKAVLVAGDEVLARAWVDLHISLTVSQS